MPKSENEIEELQALQREAAELRAKRRQAATEANDQDDRKSGSTELQEAAERLLDKAIETGQALEHDADEALHNLAGRIETAAAELEEATRKRPIVALLAAVTVGIIIGQLFSRR
jgi:ElaB/YqjD/DUF883 family membrane-anchored ribosome-binding protein